MVTCRQLIASQTFLLDPTIISKSMGHVPAMTTNPASRQKNCDACVQIKRRCDRRSPICTRCVERKLNCVYRRPRKASASQTRHEDGMHNPYAQKMHFADPATHFMFPQGTSSALDYSSTIPLDPQFGTMPPGTLSTAGFDFPSAIDPSLASFIKMLEPEASSVKQQWHSPNIGSSSMSERSGSPADEGTQLAYQKMAAFCVSRHYPQVFLSVCFTFRSVYYLGCSDNLIRPISSHGRSMIPKRR